MTSRQMAISIGLDGKAQILSDLKDVGDSGDAAFQKIGKAANDSTAQIDRQHQALQNLRDAQARVQAESASGQGSAASAASAFFPQEMERQAQVAQLKAIQAGQNFQSTLNQAFNIGGGAKSASESARAFEAEAAAQAALASRAASLKAELDPLGAAQTKMNQAVAEADSLLSAGLITQSEHTAATSLARKAYADTAAMLAALSIDEGVSITKTRELSEVFVHLAEGATKGGFSLRQLGMALGDTLRASSGEGGLGGALSAFGSILTNPYVLGGAAIVGTIAAIVAAFTRAQSAEHAYAQATEFLGRATGATRDQLDALAHSAANSNDISVAAARDIEVAYARTGAVGANQLGSLIDLTQKYFRVTDESMSQAQADLVKAFADPAKAGEELLARLGALDDKTKDYITTAMKNNDVAGAQQALLIAITGAIKNATDQTTWYGNAWAWVKTSASNTLEWLAGHMSDTAQLANLQNQLAGAQSDNPGGFRNAQIALLQKQIAGLQAKLGAASAAASSDAADQAANRLSLLGGPIVRATTPGFGDLKTLETQRSVLNQLAGSDAAMKKLGVTTAEVAASQDALNRAVATYLDPATKAQRLNDLDIAALNARTPAQKAAIAEQRTALELAGKAVTTAEANRQIQAAGAKAYADAAHAVDRHTAALGANLTAQLAIADAYLKGAVAGQLAEAGTKKLDEEVGSAAVTGAKQAAQLALTTDAQKRVNDAVAAGTMTTQQAAREMQLQTALGPLLIAQALAEGAAKKELARIIAALTAARANDNGEQTRAKALQLAETGDRNIALLKQELAIANDNDNAREVELAILQAKQELLKDNISAESDEGKRIIANAAAAAQVNQQLALAKASRGELESTFDSVSNRFASFITQGKYNWNEFKKAALGALQDIEGEFIKLGVLNPIKNGLFGENLPTLGSVGGALGAIGSVKGTPADPVYVVDLGGMFGGMGGAAGVGSGIASAASMLSGGSSWFSTAVDWIANLFHDGGVVGLSGAGRAVPAGVFLSAPRLHSGAFLGPDEVPAILQTGERVLNRQEAQAYNSSGRGAPPAMTVAPTVQVIVQGHVYGDDALKEAMKQAAKQGAALGYQQVKADFPAMSAEAKYRYAA